MFGYKTEDYSKPADMINAIKKVKNLGDYIFTISTKRTPDGGGDDKFWYQDLDIAGNHAYMLKPKKVNGKIYVDLINPWHSDSVSCTLTLEQLDSLGCFSFLAMVKVK